MALALRRSVPYDEELMRRYLALLLLVSGVSAAPERTCNIPVFRYALQRGTAAPYEVVAFHRGPLNEEAKEALNVLRGSAANIVADRIDVSEPIPPKWKVALEKAKVEPPCMVAVFPGTEIV